MSIPPEVQADLDALRRDLEKYEKGLRHREHVPVMDQVYERASIFHKHKLAVQWSETHPKIAAEIRTYGDAQRKFRFADRFGAATADIIWAGS